MSRLLLRGAIATVAIAASALVLTPIAQAGLGPRVTTQSCFVHRGICTTTFSLRGKGTDQILRVRLPDTFYDFARVTVGPNLRARRGVSIVGRRFSLGGSMYTVELTATNVALRAGATVTVRVAARPFTG